MNSRGPPERPWSDAGGRAWATLVSRDFHVLALLLVEA